MSVNSQMTALADAVREKTGGVEPMTIAQMTQEIQELEVGGGSLPTLTNPGSGAQVLQGYQLIGQDGSVVDGSIVTRTQAIPQISVSSNGLITATTTEMAGYFPAATRSATNQLTTQAAQTITPGTSDKTVSSGRYLTGTQTIKGDANLKPENIVSGVSIFGVEGTAQIGGGGDSAVLDAMIASTVTSVTSHASKVATYRFKSTATLLEAHFPNAESIGTYAFQMCTNLATFTAPVCRSVGSYAFDQDYKLTALEFPAAESVGTYAFQNCNTLKKIDFPVLESIAANAFRQCSKLEALILRNTEDVVTLSNTSAFTSSSVANGSGYIYVPAALLDDYKSASNWSNYAAQIRAIEDYPNITGG